MSSTSKSLDRRTLLGVGAALAGGSLVTRARAQEAEVHPRGRKDHPVMVGSANALAGMKLHYDKLKDGADPLDVAIEVVKVVEADPNDSSVGYGGLPDEEGRVTLDASCMHGPTHNAGSVGCIQNIMHPSEVAKLVMERTDHVYLVGEGAYRFARLHGHEHVNLLTESSRKRWLDWKESHSQKDDRLPPPPPRERKHGSLNEGEEREEKLAQADPRLATQSRQEFLEEREWGTIHCSALSTLGEVGCTTTTSGLSWKIPGRIGDSPIVGAGMYCDQEAGSAGATGRGEAAILSCGSFAICELMRQGASALDAGLEVMARVARHCERNAAWQPSLMGEDGRPAFNLNYYVLGLDGSWAGVRLKGGGRFAVSDPDGGPRHEEVVPYFK